jgi:hypothetical protein
MRKEEKKKWSSNGMKRKEEMSRNGVLGDGNESRGRGEGNKTKEERVRKGYIWLFVWARAETSSSLLVPVLYTLPSYYANAVSMFGHIQGARHLSYPLGG